MENNFNTSTHAIRNFGSLTSVASKSIQTKHSASQVPSGANTELVAWYEQAYAYYNAVMAGDPNTPKPSAEAWNNFIQQMQWAAGQLGYGQPQAWDPMPRGAMAQAQPQLSVPAGANVGVMDNIVWTEAKADILFDGQHPTHDIWSNEVSIKVPSLSAQVTSELTTDTRLNPHEEVMKIVVRDSATGQESVYFVHDYEDATIKIQSPQEGQLEDLSNLVAWEKFDAAAKRDTSRPEASLEGVVQPDGSIVYEPEFSGETVDFFAQGGEDQQHIVYADANISVRPSDEVEIHQGKDSMILVMVKHRDGSIDYYEVQKGYKVNINANSEYVSILGKNTAEVPESLAERVTINGDTSQVGEASSDSDIDADKIIEDFISATGLNNETQLMNALKSAKYDFDNIEAFKKALKDGSFPGKLDAKFGEFLFTLDKEIQNAWNKSGVDGAGVTKRMVELLQILMPNEIVTALSTSKGGKYEGAFTITGKRYDWMVYGNNPIEILENLSDDEDVVKGALAPNDEPILAGAVI
ncbi:MAG: hypothetical protein IT572_12135 [Deltaproteobacteria bacterium]|nr:hypothetical protein [Deltaproteobacteria bacterium]